MSPKSKKNILEKWKKERPELFAPLENILGKVHVGDRIFLSTGCGEPQYLVQKLIDYVEKNKKSFFDTEILQVWTLGAAPQASDKFKDIFRHQTFFISNNTRQAINEGRADYTPVFLSELPELFRKGQVPVDIALVQTSIPDEFGYLSLGISVDIVKTAVEEASLVVAQVNEEMPRVLGDSFIHLDQLDCMVPHTEPLLEFEHTYIEEEKSQKIGKYVSRIIESGDTIQVGYGTVPNSAMYYLEGKKNLGVHTEMLTESLVHLIRSGVVDNSKKTLDNGKTIAAFCMANEKTYQFLDNNPAIEFKPVDYTNNPINVARQDNMVSLNSALQIDLTGQATAESVGGGFYSGLGGNADFMRGASMARGGKSIIAMRSTDREEKVSRIVPQISPGSGITYTRGDVRFVVTEYGIAYLHGKNIRERAMSLISIAHPRFRNWLIEEAKKLSLIYEDQAFIPGERGEYPEHLEAHRTTRKGMELFLRPVKINDEPLIKDFFYSLSDQTLYQRFLTLRRHIPREELQNRYVVIDYTREMLLLAVRYYLGVEVVVGIAQYVIEPSTMSAEVSVVVRDDFQSKGIGSEILWYLIYVAKKQGLKEFTANVLPDNTPVFRLLEKSGLQYEKKFEDGIFFVNIKL